MSNFEQLDGAYRKTAMVLDEASQVCYEAEEAVLDFIAERLALEDMFDNTKPDLYRLTSYEVFESSGFVRAWKQAWWRSWEADGYLDIDLALLRMSLEEHKEAIEQRKAAEKEKELKQKEIAAKVKEEKEYQTYLELKRKYG